MKFRTAYCFGIFGWLLGVALLNGTARSAVANLVIIYDEYEGIVTAKNMAISVDMRVAFKSQAAPILLPGNLALRIAMLQHPPAAEPLDLLRPKNQKWYNNFIHQMDAKLRIIERKKAPSRGAKDKKGCLLKAALEKEYKEIIATFFESSNRYGQYGEPVGRATTVRRIVKQLHGLIRRTRCGDIPQQDSIEKYTNMFFHGVNLRDWRMFLVTMPNKQPTPQRLVLFVPVRYVRAHNAFQGNIVQLAKLGFNKTALEVVSAENLAKQVARYNFFGDGKKTALSIKQIFNFLKPSVRFNIYLVGHGGLPKTRITPITVSVSDHWRGPFIAGMSGHEFLALMNIWTLLPVNIVIYNTCYGGGVNAQAIRQMFLVATSIVRGKQNGLNLPTVISIASGDWVTKSYDGDLKKFFDKLCEIFIGKEKSIEQQKMLLGEACKHISRDSPLILFSPKQKARDAIQSSAKQMFERSQQLLQQTAHQKSLQEHEALRKKLEESFIREGTTLIDWARSHAQARLRTHIINPDDLAREVEQIINERLQDEAARELSASGQLRVPAGRVMAPLQKREKTPEFEFLRGVPPIPRFQVFIDRQPSKVQKQLRQLINRLPKGAGLVDIIELMDKQKIPHDVVQRFIEQTVDQLSDGLDIYNVAFMAIKRKLPVRLIEKLLHLPQAQEMPATFMAEFMAALVYEIEPLHSKVLIQTLRDLVQKIIKTHRKDLSKHDLQELKYTLTELNRMAGVLAKQPHRKKR